MVDELEQRFARWTASVPVDMPPAPERLSARRRTVPIFTAVTVVVGLIVVGLLVARPIGNKSVEVGTGPAATASPPTVPASSPVLSIRRPVSKAVAVSLDVFNESALLERIHERQPGCAADQSFRLDVLADGRGLLPDLLTPRQPLEGFFAPAEKPSTFITWAWTDDRYTELIYAVVVRANDLTAMSAAFLIDGVSVDHTSLENGWGVLAAFVPHRPDDPHFAISGVLQVAGSAGSSEVPVSSQDPPAC